MAKEEELERKNIEYWNRFTRNYDANIDRAYGRGMRPIAADRLLREKGLGNTLEMGCGMGFFTPILAGMADHIVVTDLAEGFLKIARERYGNLGNAVFGLANCERTAFPDESFNTVFMGFVASVDEKKRLAEIRRILKPGGAYIAILPGTKLLDIFGHVKYYYRRLVLNRDGKPPKYAEYMPEEYRKFARGAGLTLTNLEILRDQTDKNSVPLIYLKAVKPGGVNTSAGSR